MRHLKLALLVSIAAFSGCKGSSSGTALLASTAAYCDCQQLLPVGDRPNYPRVAQPYTGAKCSYGPQLAAEAGGLTVSAHAAATRIAYDDIAQDVLAAYARVDVERDLLVSNGGVAVVARGQGTTGPELVTVTWVQHSGRAIVTRERRSGAPSSLEVPSYLAPLVALTPKACVKN